MIVTHLSPMQPEGLCRLQKTLELGPILSQCNLIKILVVCFFNINITYIYSGLPSISRTVLP